MWSRMAAPVAGEGAEEVDDPLMLFIPVPVMRAPAVRVTTMEAVRVTRVVSGDWWLRMMVPSTMAGETESSSGEVGMVAKASSVHSTLEDT